MWTTSRNMWRKFYVLDDLLYHEAVEKLKGAPISPGAAYSYLIRFLELWGSGGAP